MIGQSCIITQYDLPCLYQSHILKFRLSPNAPIDKYLFFALLNAPIVKRQMRSLQFTADIIDTLGNRYLEIVLPVPQNEQLASHVIDEMKSLVDQRVELREHLRRVPLLAQGIIDMIDSPIPSDIAFYYEANSNIGFTTTLRQISKKIFMPKYYDPELERDLAQLSNTHELVSLAELIRKRIVTWKTGIEVGKMAYGTGSIPFIRTSDISNWELKADPKQSVSEALYMENQQDVQAKDIFMVRDGTYLVGTSCIVTEQDTKILYCGGLYKLRVEKEDELDPYLLIALLNTPIVKRQMRAKQFTRDIIDTLGKLLFEVIIPIPKSPQLRSQVTQLTRNVIESRVSFRDRAKNIVLEVEGKTSIDQNDMELLENI